MMSIPFPVRAILASADAAKAHDSADSHDAATIGKGVDVGNVPYVAAQVNTTGLTGTLNATMTIYTSIDGLGWDVKDDVNGDPVTVTLDVATGTKIISLNGVVSEQFVKGVYAPVGVTGGTVELIFFGKGAC